MAVAKKIRLDQLLTEKGLFASREKAQSAIIAGCVKVKGVPLCKPGSLVARDCSIEILAKVHPYVSRGGLKLEYALKTFGYSVNQKICMDIGASTGGFSDCLLQHGASFVVSVDVGYGQLDFTLRNHPQILNLENTNARFLKFKDLAEKFERASEISTLVCDASFISLRLLLTPLSSEFPFIRDWFLLFKPQFEVGPKLLKKGGILRNEGDAQIALSEFLEYAISVGFVLGAEPILSPIEGKKSGNKEYLVYFKKNYAGIM